jgi:DNA replicative helicase MCM subunit Mcm2 (Cdc46/Mcm family)
MNTTDVKILIKNKKELNMEDKTLTCQDCGEEFIFTAGEQEFFEEKGFDEPRRCKECRDKKKAEKRGRGSFRRY